jgi:hypothetical protein
MMNAGTKTTTVPMFGEFLEQKNKKKKEKEEINQKGFTDGSPIRNSGGKESSMLLML